VPKFGSFKPKAPEKADGGSSRQKPDEKEERESKRRSQHKSRDHKDRGVRKDEHGYVPSSNSARIHGREHSSRHEAAPSTSFESPLRVASSSNIFLEDSKGDESILTMGLNRRAVPDFHRLGKGRIMGSSSSVRIERDPKYLESPRVGDKRKAGTAQERRLEMRHLTNDANVKYLRSQIDEQPEAMEEFVQLTMDTDNEESEDEKQSENEADREPKQDLEARLVKRGAELWKLVLNEPEKLSNWLNFIEHKEKTMLMGRTELTPDEELQLREIQLPLYQKAFEKVQGEDEKTTLQIHIVREKTWTGTAESKLKTWETCISTTEGSKARVRLAFIDRVQNDSTLFKFEKVKEEYFQLFRELKSDLEQSSSEKLVRRVLEMQAYAVLRFSVMLREAGYHELALAMWQAILDFCIPENSSRHQNQANRNSLEFTRNFTETAKHEQSTKLDLFGQFWESEQPRLGEDGHGDWQEYNAGVRTKLPDAVPETSFKLESGAEPWRSFVDGEYKLAEMLKLPGRTIDDAGEDDPFHVVLFEDIKPILSSLWSPFETPVYLLMAFLCFIGLPPVEIGVGESCRKWWDDTLVSTHAIELSSKGELNPRIPDYVGNRRVTVDILFNSDFKDIAVPDSKWISAILLCLLNRLDGSPALAEYCVAYTLATNGAK
jgi:hypothetical protein